jgi:uroporphyrinogen-III synthase
LLPPEDPMVLKALIARLAEFDLAIFVSPAAVHAFAATFRRMYGRSERHVWPPATRIAAVGAATREAALASLPGACDAQIICPPGDTAADGGSDALVSAIKELTVRPQAVLLVRAQSGRQRLIDWLQGHGAGVEEAVAYRRVAHEPKAAQWSALRASVRAGTRLAVLYTSSEAVSVLAKQFEPDQELADALADSIALCTHERIERELRARGFTDVRVCGMEPDFIERALRGSAEPPAPSLEVDLLL